MKQIALLTLMSLFCFSTLPAQAGPARRHTLEGIAIGTGIALMGTALVQGLTRERAPSCERRGNYPRHREPGYGPPHRSYANHAPRGHWELQKVWIADEYERRWNPGHYNRRGHWVEGCYEKFLVNPGYWQAERVWVSHKFNH